jgi:Domain of unknown function (DUF4159)
MPIRPSVSAGAVRRYRRVVPLLLAVLVLSAGYTYAQFGRGVDNLLGFGGLRGEQGDPAEIPPAELPDRNVTACHILYRSVRREANGAGWRTDYPWGGRHLLIRLSELTKTRVSWLTPMVPHMWLVRLTDDQLFNCPYLMASDVGTIGLSDEEAAHLRLYLEKGGFLWVDDFWGEAAWAQWTHELAKAMPPAEYPIEDVPLSDPIFKSMFEVKKVPQVTSIRFWRAAGGRTTSERGAETAVAHLRGIRDKHGRIIVVMTHNTDVSDSWEREGEDPQFFYQFSPDGYALGINVFLYAMTH